MSGIAATVVAWISCDKMIAPGRAPARIWRSTRRELRYFQSSGSTDQRITFIPNSWFIQWLM
jgi:hypothetical protein